MKVPSTVLLGVALSLIVSVDQTVATKCFEHSALNVHEKTMVPCPMVNENSPIRKRQDVPIPGSGSGSGSSSSSSPNVINQANSQDMFQIAFTCGISDQTLCGKVKQAFVDAGQIITSTLLLNTPIVVNATFTDFCASMGDCGSASGFLTLGGAAPARTIPVQDPDGKQRFYAQALVKQFGYSSHPQFGPYDIVAMFNSAVPSYWFTSDGTQIGPDQSDFLWVVLHELIHGLGFTSSWDDYINQVPQALTPEPYGEAVNGKVQLFVEYAFDRFMVVIPQKENATQFASMINQFSGDIQNPDAFVASFESSPQYAYAQQMFSFGTTRNALGFLPSNVTNLQNSVILETSLVPYQEGSSISHVDYNTYSNTSDFLMRFLQDRGVSLQNAILAGGNYSGGPIGPKLKSVLESMGYATRDNPHPFIPTLATTSKSSTIISETKLGFLVITAAVTLFISYGNLLL